MRKTSTLLLLLLLAACSEKEATLSLQVFPAVLAADATAQHAGWDTLHYEGGARAPQAIYLVAPEPLFTEWNIVAFRPSPQADETLAVAARLNAYAGDLMQRFSADPANLKKPLALRIDGRWADLMPLLDQVRDRITLYGFTPAEIERLQRHMATR